MLGLVNAIGSAEAARQLQLKPKEEPEQYGLKVPIPAAQREAKAESESAIVSLTRGDEDLQEGVRSQPDSDRQAEQAISNADLGRNVDMLA